MRSYAVDMQRVVLCLAVVAGCATNHTWMRTTPEHVHGDEAFVVTQTFAVHLAGATFVDGAIDGAPLRLWQFPAGSQVRFDDDMTPQENATYGRWTPVTPPARVHIPVENVVSIRVVDGVH